MAPPIKHHQKPEIIALFAQGMEPRNVYGLYPHIPPGTIRDWCNQYRADTAPDTAQTALPSQSQPTTGRGGSTAVIVESPKKLESNTQVYLPADYKKITPDVIERTISMHLENPQASTLSVMVALKTFLAYLQVKEKMNQDDWLDPTLFTDEELTIVAPILIRVRERHFAKKRG